MDCQLGGSADRDTSGQAAMTPLIVGGSCDGKRLCVPRLMTWKNVGMDGVLR